MLLGSAADRKVLAGAAKTVASTCFLGAAVLWGALESAYGQLILLALVLSWFGDVLLVPRARPAFLVGIAAFLLAHVAFAFAFAARGLDTAGMLAALVVMCVSGGVVLKWLWRHLSGLFRPAVVLYVVAIVAMVVMATGAVVAGAGMTLLSGAVLFTVSDLSVARDRFVSPRPHNVRWGLPMYYVAQFLLASTVNGVG
ncbi:MAG: lysoplasmalogenase [Ectothiorhodospiraceae bacterium]|nr:lysoplasmalogenase [Ectothiorhodospiraceae bacterium]